MAQVGHIICITSGKQSTSTLKSNSGSIIIKESCKRTQDSNVLPEEIDSEVVCELQCSNNNDRNDCKGSASDVKPISENDEKSSDLTTVTSACRIFKTDGTMVTSVLDIQHGSESEEFKHDSDTIDNQEENESSDVKDISSDDGDDDDDFSYLSDVSHNESETPDNDLTSKKDGRPKSPRNQFVKCPQCDKCVRKRHLDDHINVTHTKSEKYLCELCGEGFLTMTRVRRHKLSKHKVGCKYIKCEECPYTTPYYSTFKRHVLSHKRKSSGNYQDLSHECKECGKFLATADGLRVHLNAHKNGKPFTCPRCAKCFSQKGNLKTHMVQHLKDKVRKTDARVYSCEQCDKVFRWPGDLCRHKKVVHLGIKKYICGECGKRFSGKNHLQEHILWHQNLKPYPCTVCHKSYRSKYRLKYHTIKCHEESMGVLDGILTDTHTSDINNSNTATLPLDSKPIDDN